MARLPNVDAAEVPQRKLVDYLLNADHPRGGPKAAFLKRFGFDRQNVGLLRAALLEHALCNYVVASSGVTEFGVSYIVERPLQTPDDRNPLVRTVWMIDIDVGHPQFITLVPLGRRKKPRRQL